MARRKIYLEPRPLGDALSLWRGALGASGALGPVEAESVAVDESLGRVTAGPVAARTSSPFFHSSAMDGVAVRFADTVGASERSPVRLKIGEQAVYLDTGDPLPEGMDAVIMVEDIDELDHGEIEIIKPAPPWQNVRVIGEDVIATELVLPAGHEIRPVDMAMMLASGSVEVEVRKRPVVTLIPTGDEIVQPGSKPVKGKIIDSNSRMLAGMAAGWGADARRFDIVPDDLDKLKKHIADAVKDSDLVAVIAGSSAGSEDFTFHAIDELGEVYMHGVNIKPGKPVILGTVEGKPVIGLPGFPVASFITFRLFARDIVYLMQGRDVPRSGTVNAKLSRQLSSKPGNEEFVRVALGKVGENVIAMPLARGSGRMMSLVKADGIVRIPEASEGLAAGSEVEVELIGELKGSMPALDKTIVCVGSHDNALDVLGGFLKKTPGSYTLSSAHVGSLAGLIALKGSEAHMAGSHLLDPDTGEYNVSYIKKHLPGKKVSLVNLVYRIQGLMVKKGNPKGITGFGDLKREDVAFINRQRGAGTRLLTDLHLKKLGIDPAAVRGYGREEYTHTGVASAVLEGVADCGLGILAAANALGLEFIPVAEERYDLVIPAEHIETPMIEALLDVIRNDSGFKKAVEALGGYDTRDMGKVMREG